MEGFVSRTLNVVYVAVPRIAVTGRFVLTVGFGWTEKCVTLEVLEA